MEGKQAGKRASEPETSSIFTGLRRTRSCLVVEIIFTNETKVECIHKKKNFLIIIKGAPVKKKII